MQKKKENSMILQSFEVKYCLKSKIERVESKVKLSSQQGDTV